MPIFYSESNLLRELVLWLITLAVHECGHILAAAILRIPFRSVDLCLPGAIITFDYSRVGYLKEGLVHLSGPLLGIVFGIGTALFFGESASYFTGISVLLSTINLLPIAGFDGEGIVKCVLSYFFLPDTVWRTSRILSGVSLFALWSLILWVEIRAGGNIGLIVFIICIMLGRIK